MPFLALVLAIGLSLSLLPPHHGSKHSAKTTPTALAQPVLSWTDPDPVVHARPAAAVPAPLTAAASASNAAAAPAALPVTTTAAPASTTPTVTLPATDTAADPLVQPRLQQLPANAKAPYALPARAAQPTGCPRTDASYDTNISYPAGHPAYPGKPAVPENKVPGAVRVPARQANLSPITGKGEWVAVFRNGKINVDHIVGQAKVSGLQNIWVRVGSSREGFYGNQFLPSLLAKAHAAGIQVVGWDFAELSDPVGDARRAAKALAYRTKSGDQLDGFSADVETPGEGTFLSAKRVTAYFSRVEAKAGNRPVIATVLRPTDYWWKAGYPYKAEARYVDAFAPMIYWSCVEPGAATAPAVDRLRSLGKPVNAVGQGYDMGPEHGRKGLPSAAETWRFVDVAARHGAIGASIYVYGSASLTQWKTLAAYPWTTG